MGENAREKEGEWEPKIRFGCWSRRIKKKKKKEKWRQDRYDNQQPITTKTTKASLFETQRWKKEWKRGQRQRRSIHAIDLPPSQIRRIFPFVNYLGHILWKLVFSKAQSTNVSAEGLELFLCWLWLLLGCGWVRRQSNPAVNLTKSNIERYKQVSQLVNHYVTSSSRQNIQTRKEKTDKATGDLQGPMNCRRRGSTRKCRSETRGYCMGTHSWGSGTDWHLLPPSSSWYLFNEQRQSKKKGGDTFAFDIKE